MPLNPILPRFPKGSQFRGIIRDLASADVKRRDAACKAVLDRCQFKSWEDARTANWQISEAEAIAVFSALESIAFPEAEMDWDDGVVELIGLFWRNPYPSLVPYCERVYAQQPQARRRCAVLALLGAIASREAATAFMNCVRTHGWPVHGFPRMFEELSKLFRFPEIMLPDAITAKGPWAEHVVDSILVAITQGWMDFSQVADRLQTLLPFVLNKLKKSLKSAAKFQQARGIEWRFAERYSKVRTEVCTFLDLAGWFAEPSLTPLLREAAGFADPRIAAFAAISLLRREATVGVRILNRVAGCHETRNILFRELAKMNKHHLFPARWQTWEQFGAAQMVEWLMYPAELGREPDQIQLECAEWVGKRREKTVVYVWKFRNRGDKWFAGITGPHQLVGQPRPLDGHLTFSRFDAWSDASPAEHIKRCTETASDFQKSSNAT